MKRALLVGLVGLVVAGSLTACGGGSDNPTLASQPSATATGDTAQSPSSTPSAGTSSVPCTPSETGSKDITKKPVFTVSKVPAPTTTTVTNIVCGTGAEATDGANVKVQYVGVNYANGVQFDASWDGAGAFPFTVGSGVIPGFSKGVTGMKIGGRRLVVIPPADGYGNGGPVPGGTLAFIIDLVSVS